MTRRHVWLAAILTSSLAMASGAARGEVFVDVGEGGEVREVRTTVVRGREARVWESVGAASRPELVLNAEGDNRGDGRPDFATNPQTGLPRAVWSRRVGSDLEIATSMFNGETWTEPETVLSLPESDDLDPRIVYRADGVAIVAWWQKQPAPVVRLAYALPDAVWRDGGVVSAAGVKARRPALSQHGSLTIVAYRTARDIGIATFTLSVSSPEFGDGPTPFPRDDAEPPGGTNQTNPPLEMP